jgi:hypothetical protein
MKMPLQAGSRLSACEPARAGGRGIAPLEKQFPSGQSPSEHRPGRSACAAASQARELERLRRMSVEARIAASLAIGGKFSWLKPAPKGE